MKKFISSFMIAVTLFTVMPAKKAESSILYMASSQQPNGVPLFLVGVGVTGFAGVAIVAGVSVLVAGTFGLPLLVFDADGSLSKEKLESSLAERYSFINDNQAISDLADAIKTKAASQKPVEGKIEVKLSPEEVESILEPTGLLETNPKDVAKLIKELN